MKEDQGDLFKGFESAKEPSVEDIRKIFNGKIITEQQYQEEIEHQKEGDALAMQLKRDGFLQDCEFPCSECKAKRGDCMLVQKIKAKHARLKEIHGESCDDYLVNRIEDQRNSGEFINDDSE